MPEEYGDLNHVVPVGTDPAKIPQAFQNYDDSLTEELLAFPPAQLATGGSGDEGKLLIVQNTGAPAFKALSGDVTVNAAGVVEIGAGKVGVTELADKGVTTAKVNDKAITLAKLAEGLGLTTGYVADGAITDAKLARPPLRGRISSAGAILHGTGFTCERTGAGVYAIKASVELPTIGIPVATLHDIAGFPNAAAIITCASVSKKEWVYRVVADTNADGAWGVLDLGFSFVISPAS